MSDPQDAAQPSIDVTRRLLIDTSLPARPEDPPVKGLDVHGVLVGVGALLLAVAAIGFLVFSWRVLSLPGRATVIGATTLVVLAVASRLRSRLSHTAEAVGALGVVLVLADCWAIRRTGLFGADRPAALGYAAGAAAGCAVLLGGWALLSRVRAGSIAAVALAPLAVVFLAARLDGTSQGLAVGFVLAAALALGRPALPARWPLERQILRWVAGGALSMAAVLSFGLDRDGAGWAGLILLAAALCAGGQAVADRVGAGSARWAMPVDASVFLRRGWSLVAGLLAGAAAIEAGLALADLCRLRPVLVLLPTAAVPALLVVLAAARRTRPGAAIRRTAFGAGTAIAAGAAALPALLLAGSAPLRAGVAALTGPWAAQPATRLAELGPGLPTSTETSTEWAVELAVLALVGTCALLAGRIGGWPAWLRRPVLLAGAASFVIALVVLPLAPQAPVGATVIGLALTAGVLAIVVLEIEDWARQADQGWTSRLLINAGWTASLFTGTLAVILAWATRELSGPLTLVGAAGLLLARRRTFFVTSPASAANVAVPGSAAGELHPASHPADAAGAVNAVLASLAALAGLIAVGALAGLAGAPLDLRITAAGVAGGILVAALIGLPRWWPSARPGRAGWSGLDRLAAAAAGLAALLVGLLSPVTSDGRWAVGNWAGSAALVGPDWPRRLLLALALAIALVGACAIRPTVARVLPTLPLACAFAASPVLGRLLGSIRSVLVSTLPAGLSDPLPPALLWAIVAGVGALALAAAVITGRVEPARRAAAEFGLVSCGLVALATVAGASSLWRALLVLGAAATAISFTPDRRWVGWLAAVLLFGSTWTRLMMAGVDTVEAYSLPPAAALLMLAGYRLRRDPSTDPGRALAPVAAIAFSPSIVVAAGGGALRPALLIVVAAALVLAGLELRRRGRHPALALALGSIGAVVAGATAGLRSAAALFEFGQHAPALSAVEFWTVPAAVIMLAQGGQWLSRAEDAESPRPSATVGPALGVLAGKPSWPAFAPGLLVLLLPSFGIGLIQVHGSPLRHLVVIALSGTALALGSVRRLQAPVVLGSSVLTAQALVLLAPWMTGLPQAIPIWGWLAAVGLGLLLLGASYERRLRQLRSLRLRLASLR